MMDLGDLKRLGASLEDCSRHLGDDRQKILLVALQKDDIEEILMGLRLLKLAREGKHDGCASD